MRTTKPPVKRPLPEKLDEIYADAEMYVESSILELTDAINQLKSVQAGLRAERRMLAKRFKNRGVTL
jgi:hypothetical protein